MQKQPGSGSSLTRPIARGNATAVRCSSVMSTSAENCFDCFVATCTCSCPAERLQLQDRKLSSVWLAIFGKSPPRRMQLMSSGQGRSFHTRQVPAHALDSRVVTDLTHPFFHPLLLFSHIPQLPNMEAISSNPELDDAIRELRGRLMPGKKQVPETDVTVHGIEVGSQMNIRERSYKGESTPLFQHCCVP